MYARALPVAAVTAAAEAAAVPVHRSRGQRTQRRLRAMAYTRSQFSST